MHMLVYKKQLLKTFITETIFHGFLSSPIVNRVQLYIVVRRYLVRTIVLYCATVLSYLWLCVQPDDGYI